MATNSSRARRSPRARSQDDFGALLAAGLVGFGVGLAAASAAREGNERRREAFRSALAQVALRFGFVLASATLGRGAENVPFWALTLAWPDGQLIGARVLLPHGVEPYSQQALEQLGMALAQIAPDHG